MFFCVLLGKDASFPSSVLSGQFSRNFFSHWCEIYDRVRIKSFSHSKKHVRNRHEITWARCDMSRCVERRPPVWCLARNIVTVLVVSDVRYRPLVLFVISNNLQYRRLYVHRESFFYGDAREKNLFTHFSYVFAVVPQYFIKIGNCIR